MIINIVVPKEKIHIHNLYGMIKEKIHRYIVFKNVPTMMKKKIIHNRDSLTFLFDERNVNEINILRRLIEESCKGLIIGVNQSNPVTANLPNVREHIFYEGA